MPESSTEAARVFDQKLRNRMLLRVLLSASLVFVVLAGVTYVFTRGLLVTQLEEKSRAKVELASSAINGWLAEKSAMLEQVALRQGQGLLPPEQRKPFFRAMCKRLGCNISLYLAFEKDGAFFTGSDWVPPKGYDPRRRHWYRKAKAAGHPTYSKPYLDPYSKRLVVTVAAPVYRDRQLLGVVAMDVFLDRILGQVAKLRIGAGSYAYLVDQRGLMITHPEKERVLKGQIQQTPDAEFYARYRAHLGSGGTPPLFENSRIYAGQDYVTFSQVARTGWVLVFHLSRDLVNRPLRRLMLIFGVGLILSLLLLALTTLYVSQRIARPILDLADGAGRIADGDYEQRLRVTSRDEVGYLTQSFNEMSAGLKDRDFIKSTFGRYVSPAVMRDILSGNIQLGGEVSDVTILFSDIRGFTTLSEGMEPPVLVSLLNRYFSRMDREIRAVGGSINKYLGDGILALYGAPERLENAAERAVESAFGMLAALQDFGEPDEPTLRIGVGIHTGEAVVGNIGSESRTEYTVIGDTVNLASRIEGLTKAYGLPVLVSDGAADRLSDAWRLRVVDRAQVKGKRVPVTLYAPYRRADLTPERAAWLDRSDAVLEAYFDGRFAEALELIAALEKEPDPGLDALLRLFKQRCEAYAEAPPEHWDGVYTHRSK